MSESILTSAPPRQRKTLLGGVKALVLFGIVLAAYVIQSQLTQYVQHDLGYRQPYAIFYIAHSSFIIIFPLHLLFLVHTTDITASQYLSGLSVALAEKFEPSSPLYPPWKPLARMVLLLTIGATSVAVLWYVAVAFAPVSDVTAIFNTNAFWAYILSVQLAEQSSASKWQSQKLLAVLLACVGVFAVVYGGGDSTEVIDTSSRAATVDDRLSSSSALFGNFLALLSSASYALYQVLYKKYATLSTEKTLPVTNASIYQPLHSDSSPDLCERDRILNPLSNILSTSGFPTPRVASPNSLKTYSVPPPFAFYPNFITSLIGLVTLLILWVPFPILDLLGIGQGSRFPEELTTWAYVSGIALTGVVYNGGFMVLLGLWGPVIVSVGNLLTIVLVLMSDIIFGNAMETVTLWNLTGCAAIVFAFGVLAANMDS